MAREFEFQIQKPQTFTCTVTSGQLMSSPGVDISGVTTYIPHNNERRIMELEREIIELRELVTQAIALKKEQISGKA